MMLVIIIVVVILVIAGVYKSSSSSTRLSANSSGHSVKYYIGDSHLYVRIGDKIIARYGNGVVVTPSAKVIGYYAADGYKFELDNGYIFDSEHHIMGECKNGLIKNNNGVIIGKYSAGDIDLHGDYPLCEYNSGSPRDALGAVAAAVALLVVGNQKDFFDTENL